MHAHKARPTDQAYSCTMRRMKFTTTAASSEIARMVGPNRSSIPLWPRFRMLWARQWNVTRAYIMAAMAMIVKRPAEMRPIRSPKLSRPTANPPRMTVKLSQDRKVRSLAKKTLGSTRVGRAMRLPVFRGGLAYSCGAHIMDQVLMYGPGAVWRSGWLDIFVRG